MKKQLNHIFFMKMAAIGTGFFLLISGVVMIFMDLKSEGSMSIKTPFIGGEINATYIGLLVIFFGVVLIVTAISRKYRQTRTTETNKTETDKTETNKTETDKTKEQIRMYRSYESNERQTSGIKRQDIQEKLRRKYSDG